MAIADLHSTNDGVPEIPRASFFCGTSNSLTRTIIRRRRPVSRLVTKRLADGRSGFQTAQLGSRLRLEEFWLSPEAVSALPGLRPTPALAPFRALPDARCSGSEKAIARVSRTVRMLAMAVCKCCSQIASAEMDQLSAFRPATNGGPTT
jgi:hypothetical protein